MLSGLEVNVITELWPKDVLQKVEVMLFFTRYTSDLFTHVRSCCGSRGCSLYCRGRARMCSLVLRPRPI